MQLSFYSLIVLFFVLQPNAKSQDGVEILNEMIEASSKINKMEVYTIMEERFHGKMQLQKSFVKVQHKPFKIYYRQDHPDKGIEILYIDGKNNNKALVKPSGFPWVNINLDPLNNLLRIKQHHTLFQPGFGYIVTIIENIIKQNGDNINDIVEYKGKVTWNDTECYEIAFTNPNFKYINYKVKAGETIDDIAREHFVGSYMIYELNKDAQTYDDVKEGEIIVIPNTYAKKLTIYVDTKQKIPLVLKIYDDKGLYEFYKFYNMKLNKEFEADEFSPKYKEYGF